MEDVWTPGRWLAQLAWLRGSHQLWGWRTLCAHLLPCRFKDLQPPLFAGLALHLEFAVSALAVLGVCVLPGEGCWQDTDVIWWGWVQLFGQRSGLGVGTGEPSQGVPWTGQGTACPSLGSRLSSAPCATSSPPVACREQGRLRSDLPRSWCLSGDSSPPCLHPSVPPNPAGCSGTGMGDLSPEERHIPAAAVAQPREGWS